MTYFYRIINAINNVTFTTYIRMYLTLNIAEMNRSIADIIKLSIIYRTFNVHFSVYLSFFRPIIATYLYIIGVIYVIKHEQQGKNRHKNSTAKKTF